MRLQNKTNIKNTYNRNKTVITGFIDDAKNNKPALGEYLHKHYFFDDIRRTIRYTGDASALGNLITKDPRPHGNKSRCFDCKKDVHKNPRDYYMVTSKIWAEHGAGREELCMSCLEKRMGRRLDRSDILECSVSTEWNPYTKNVFGKG